MRVRGKWYYFFGIGIIMGAISFILIYGLSVIDVKNDLWLKSTERDLYAHYLGWKYFRQSSWHFPIGMMDGIVYPDLVSIIYTDSIPLFAIIFKILSPILPETFQYFGIWGLVCFMLQGGIATLIIRKFTDLLLPILIFTEVFVLSPSIMHRMYYHTELAAHFLILLALLIWLYGEKFNSFKKRVLAWSILFALTASVHIYFIPMVFIIMFCSILELMVKQKKYLLHLVTLFIPCIIGLIILAILGAFGSNRALSKEGGLGFYSANMNSLFNSQGWGGRFLDLPLATTGQHEGYAYLGGGLIILLFISVIVYILEIYHNKNDKNIYWVVCFLISFIISLSPSVSVNSKIIFNIPLPEGIITILEMFRATGRFLWINVYLILIFIIYITSRNFNSIVLYMILGGCSLIQIYDLAPIIKLRYHIANKNYIMRSDNNYVYMNSLNSSAWNEIVKGYKHIELLKEEMTVHSNYIDSFSLADLAIDNGLTISNFPVARPNIELRKEKNEKILKELEEGKSREDTIYIFESLFDILGKKMNLYIYKIDNIIIATKNKIQCSNENDIILISNPYDEHKKIIEDFKSKEFAVSELGLKLKDGSIINDGISEGYVLYGPYKELEDGVYDVTVNFTIFEQNMEKKEQPLGFIDIASNLGKKLYQKKYIYSGDNSISLQNITLYDIKQLEIRLYSYGNAKIQIKSYEIEQIKDKYELYSKMFNGEFNWLTLCEYASDVTRSSENFSMINSGLMSEHVQFGPYVKIPNGTYNVVLDYEVIGQIENQKNELGNFDIVSNFGNNFIAEQKLKADDNECIIENIKIRDFENIEFRTYVYKGNIIKLNQIKIVKKN